MNTQSLAQFIADEPVLGRILLASVELLALCAVVSIAIRLFRPKSARLVSFLWVLVLAKPLFALAFGPLVPIVQLQTPPPVVEEITLAQAPLLEYEVMVIENTPGATSLPYESMSPSTSDSPSTLASPSPQPPPRFTSSQVLLFAWVLGISLTGVWILIDRIRLAIVTKRSKPVEEETERIYAALTHELAIRNAPRLRITNVFGSPAIASLIRPVIFLPPWLIQGGNRTQLRWAMHHELIHYRHGDPIAISLRQLTRCLFFFHPAAWWAGRKWEEAAELACDRALVNDANDVDNYTANLYEMMRLMQRRRRPLISGLFATRTQVGRRINALLNEALNSPKRLSAVAIAFLLATATITLTVGAATRGPVDTEPSKATPETDLMEPPTNESQRLVTAENQQTDPDKQGDTSATDQAFTPRRESEWRPAFDAVYSLEENEALKRIAVPFIPERMDYYWQQNPGQAEAVPTGPDTMRFRWNEDSKLSLLMMTFGKPGNSFAYTLRDAVGLKQTEYTGGPRVLDIHLSGDWIRAENSTMVSRLAAFRQIIFAETGRDIHFKNTVINSDAITVRGTFRLSKDLASPNAKRLAIPDPPYVTLPQPGQLRTDLDGFLAWAGIRLGIRFVNESTYSPTQVIWLTQAAVPDEFPEQDRDALIEKLLQSLAAETNLTFTKERRDTAFWTIKEVGLTQEVMDAVMRNARGSTASNAGDAPPSADLEKVTHVPPVARPQTLAPADAREPNRLIHMKRSGRSTIYKAEYDPRPPSEWRLAFEALYRLQENEVLKRIPLPFIAERIDYMVERRGYLRTEGNRPNVMSFSWIADGQLKEYSSHYGGNGGTLGIALRSAVRLKRMDYEGDEELIALELPGDWIAREGADPEPLLDALHEIILESTGRDIRFEKTTGQRDVIVARGDYQFTQHRTSSWGEGVVMFAGDSAAMPRGGGGGTGDLNKFLARVGDRIGTRFINEASALKEQIIELKYHPSTYGRTLKQNRPALVDRLLKNLTAQTNLTFTKERRDVDFWAVTEHGTTPDADNSSAGSDFGRATSSGSARIGSGASIKPVAFADAQPSGSMTAYKVEARVLRIPKNAHKKSLGRRDSYGLAYMAGGREGEEYDIVLPQPASRETFKKTLLQATNSSPLKFSYKDKKEILTNGFLSIADKLQAELVSAPRVTITPGGGPMVLFKVVVIDSDTNGAGGSPAKFAPLSSAEGIVGRLDEIGLSPEIMKLVGDNPGGAVILDVSLTDEQTAFEGLALAVAVTPDPDSSRDQLQVAAHYRLPDYTMKRKWGVGRLKPVPADIADLRMKHEESLMPDDALVFFQLMPHSDDTLITVVTVEEIDATR